MAIRNCREMGENLQTIITRLMANDTLVKLLYYTDTDPLSKPNLTNTQKQELIFDKLIKMIPRIGPKDTVSSLVSVRVNSGREDNNNSEFKNITIIVESFVPLTQWYIKSSNLRIFAIMGEIQDSLNKKTINGLGKITGGDFELEFITEELVSYSQIFSLTTYD